VKVNDGGVVSQDVDDFVKRAQKSTRCLLRTPRETSLVPLGHVKSERSGYLAEIQYDNLV
jgi:hypothetical protein